MPRAPGRVAEDVLPSSRLTNSSKLSDHVCVPATDMKAALEPPALCPTSSVRPAGLVHILPGSRCRPFISRTQGRQPPLVRNM